MNELLVDHTHIYIHVHIHMHMAYVSIHVKAWRTINADEVHT